jgi:hypothetical protein
MRPKCSKAEFIALYREVGPTEAGRILGVNLRSIHQRRERIERSDGIQIIGPNHQNPQRKKDFPGRLNTKLYDGIMMVGSDHHYWPGEPSTAHKAFVKLAKELRPKIVIANGDVCDFGQISRHPPLGWDEQPTVKEQIDVASLRLDEIKKAAPRAERFWPLGNHDSRLEQSLVRSLPELSGVHGTHLSDHFDETWQRCWSVFINDDTEYSKVVVKHRFKSGIHAPWNNAIHSGVSIVTGHLHSQKVYPFSDYIGTRWGVDAGCMADPYGAQFEYAEDSPRNWRSGFCVLTFIKGELLQPELVRVVRDGVVDFRGELVNV